MTNKRIKYVGLQQAVEAAKGVELAERIERLRPGASRIRRLAPQIVGTVPTQAVPPKTASEDPDGY